MRAVLRTVINHGAESAQIRNALQMARLHNISLTDTEEQAEMERNKQHFFKNNRLMYGLCSVVSSSNLCRSTSSAEKR